MSSVQASAHDTIDDMRRRMEADELAVFQPLFTRMRKMWEDTALIDHVRIVGIHAVNENEHRLVVTGLAAMNTGAMKSLTDLRDFKEYCAEVTMCAHDGTVTFVMMKTSRSCMYTDNDPMPSFACPLLPAGPEIVHGRVIPEEGEVGPWEAVVARFVLICERVYPTVPEMHVHSDYEPGDETYTLRITGLPSCCYSLIVLLERDLVLSPTWVSYDVDEGANGVGILTMTVNAPPDEEDRPSWLMRVAKMVGLSANKKRKRE